MFGRFMDNGSLPQKVDYDLDKHLIVGKQKKWKKVIEWIITIIGWMIMLSYVLYVIYGNLALQMGWNIPTIGIYNREMLAEVNSYYMILLYVLLVSLVVFIFWKNYNKKKYGSYHRRTFRPEVSVDELSEKFNISAEVIKDMQNSRVTVLEKNIIPKEMGIGQKN